MKLSDHGKGTEYRPNGMRIDEERCTHCGVCSDIMPEILLDRRAIPVRPDMLDAMAECPMGAIVWLESEADPRPAGDATEEVE